MQKKKLWLIFAVIIVVILGFLIWLAPNATVGSNHESIRSSAQNTTGLLPTASDLPHASGLPFVSNSQQDTEINCQLVLDQGNRLVVNEQTRNCLNILSPNMVKKILTRSSKILNPISSKVIKNLRLSKF